MKLQDAYVTEANTVGNYTMIGYEMPGSTTFDYTEPAPGFSADGTIMVTSLTSLKPVWQATNKVDLNNCTSGKYWTLSAEKGSGSGVDYTAGIGAQNATAIGDNNCLSLTSSFKTIGDNN